MMIYTDGIHMIGDSVNELHKFAEKIDLKRCYFHGTKKGHPHYDLTNKNIRDKAIKEGALYLDSKSIVLHFQKLKLL